MSAWTAALIVAVVWTLGSMGTWSLATLRACRLRNLLRERDDTISAYEGRLAQTESRLRALDSVVDHQCVMLTDRQARLRTACAMLEERGVDIGETIRLQLDAEPRNHAMPEPLLRMTPIEVSALDLAVRFVDDGFLDNDDIQEKLGVTPEEWNALVDKIRALNE